jgi:hypothetical protein
MSKIALAAATILSLTAVAAQAQTTTETTTTQSNVPYSVPVPVPVPVPVAPPAQVSQSTTQRTVDGNGVVTDHTRTVTTGTTVGPYGDTTTTRRTVDSTSSH